MLRIFLITLTLLIFSSAAFSFNYHGIESGMTKEQIIQVLKILGHENIPENLNSMKFKPSKLKLHPESITYNFDQNNKLYQLNFIISPGYDSNYRIGILKDSYEEKYQADVEIYKGIVLKIDITDKKMALDFYKHFLEAYKGEI